jgi:hypothetical protein
MSAFNDIQEMLSNADIGITNCDFKNVCKQTCIMCPSANKTKRVEPFDPTLLPLLLPPKTI